MGGGGGGGWGPEEMMGSGVGPECHVKNQGRYPVVLTQNEVLNEVPNHPTSCERGKWGKGRGGGTGED